MLEGYESSTDTRYTSIVDQKVLHQYQVNPEYTELWVLQVQY